MKSKDEEFQKVIDRILLRDQRYASEAYAFVSDAVSYTAEKIHKAKPRGQRHVSGQELITGSMELALKQFGPLAGSVFSEWGIKNGPSIGNVVFTLIGEGILRASENDKLEDFSGFDNLCEALDAPFKTRASKLMFKAPIIE